MTQSSLVFSIPFLPTLPRLLSPLPTATVGQQSLFPHPCIPLPPLPSPNEPSTTWKKLPPLLLTLTNSIESSRRELTFPSFPPLDRLHPPPQLPNSHTPVLFPFFFLGQRKRRTLRRCLLPRRWRRFWSSCASQSRRSHPRTG